ncbi:MAG: hypothetical protein IH987_03935 [Planctomycetes bacterium]|nr:hypothetical protein [Planctomycetota bacterium]
MRVLARYEVSCGGPILAIAASLALSGCGPAINLNTTTNLPADECPLLAEEIIGLTQQLIQLSDETGEIDVDFTCRLTAAQLRLLDLACPGAVFPVGVDRDSLLSLQAEFNCPAE